MSPIFRDIFIVARHDLHDSFRSKRVIVWLALYLAGSIGACSLFIYTLHQIETELARVASLSESASTGAMTQSLWETKSFLNIVKGLVGDEELAKKLVTTPPLALFFGWISMTFAPFLVMLLSSETVSSEVSSGSVRFILFRTSRFSWTTGKAIGQIILLGAALFFSASGALLSGMIGLSHFETSKTLVSLGELFLKTWVYCLSFVGLSMAVSQWTKSVQISRGLGIITYFFLSILAGIADHFAGGKWSLIWELILILTPQGHRIDFWRPDMIQFLNATLFSFGLGVLYFISGYAVFSRRDL